MPAAHTGKHACPYARTYFILAGGGLLGGHLLANAARICALRPPSGKPNGKPSGKLVANLMANLVANHAGDALHMRHNYGNTKEFNRISLFF